MIDYKLDARFAAIRRAIAQSAEISDSQLEQMLSLVAESRKAIERTRKLLESQLQHEQGQYEGE